MRSLQTTLSSLKALQYALSSSGLAAGVVEAVVHSPQTVLPVAAADGRLQQQRCKHSVRMVLLKDHEQLGRRGDIVKVKAGHARYTLFPQGIADYALPSVLRDLKAQGALTPEALLQLQGGHRQQGAAAITDPSSLPHEQQLPEIIQLLSEKVLVIPRRFNRLQEEQPMVGQVTARHIAACAAQQFKVDLPSELILMHKNSPITHFGSFKVPLNLRDDSGQQVEIEVVVEKTLRSSRVRQQNEQYKLFVQQRWQQQQQQQQKRAAQQ